MPAAQHQRGAGLADARNQFRQRQPGFHITAHRIQNHQQPFYLGILLNVHQLGDDVLIFCRLLRVGRQRMALDRADDRQAVDGVAALGGWHNAVFLYQIMLQPLQGGAFGGVVLGADLFILHFHHCSPSLRKLYTKTVCPAALQNMRGLGQGCRFVLSIPPEFPVLFLYNRIII